MKQLIDCAMKREPCDLLIEGATILNVFTGETEQADIAVKDGRIAALGKGYEAKEVYDGRGLVALPGLMDAHIHVESSLLSPEAFAQLAVAHGTTGIVADPHELVNVCGIAGAEYVKEAFSRIRKDGIRPLDVFLQLPSCVPATPFETSGAVINGTETAHEIRRPLFHGLGEMMNYPGVIAGDEDTLRKIEAAHAAGKVVDGHAPDVRGDALNAYLAAGIATDHECGSPEECAEKIARGMYVQLRNSSSAHNLEVNCAAVTPFNFRRFLACSDDKNAADLASKGHIDDALRRLVAHGVPAAEAVCMATLNIAECYHIQGKGAVAPSYDADLVLVDNLTDFNVKAVFKRGVLVAEHGKPLFDEGEHYLPDAVKSTVRIRPVTADDFKLEIGSGRALAMTILPHTLVTEGEVVSVRMKDGDVVLENTDLLKLAVVERHFATGNIGKALLKGYGFHGGALAVSMAHDSHNLVVLGDDNAAMARAVQLLESIGGGMALVTGEGEDCFPLDIAGLMSSAPCEEVVARTGAIGERARKMGVKDCYEPIMTLVFLSLLVIPKLKLSDKGLFDVDKFRFTSLEVTE